MWFDVEEWLTMAVGMEHGGCLVDDYDCFDGEMGRTVW